MTYKLVLYELYISVMGQYQYGDVSPKKPLAENVNSQEN